MVIIYFKNFSFNCFVKKNKDIDIIDLKEHNLTETYNAIRLDFKKESYPRLKYDNLTLICIDTIDSSNASCTNNTNLATWSCTCQNLKQIRKYSLHVATNNAKLGKSRQYHYPNEIYTSSLK
jgi:hypothetical protein